MDLITLGLLCAGAVCIYMIGYNVAHYYRDKTINDTILYLCDQGYIRHYMTENNELEIVKLNGDLDNGEEKEDTSS